MRNVLASFDRQHRAIRTAGLLACALWLSAGCRIVPPTGLPPLGRDPPTSGGGTSGTTPPTPPPPASVSATALEQLLLERINRARLRPASEAARYGIALDEGIPGQISATSKQPLAMNPALTSVARAHSQDMLDRDYFAHENLSGDSPFDRMLAAGYQFWTAGENLAWRGTTGILNLNQAVEMQHEDLFVDTGIDGRGHRVTMLNPNFKEVGIGVIRGYFTQAAITYDSAMVTQDFGARAGSTVYVTGVVYDDANHNGDYDVGEGRGGESVVLGTVSTTTNPAGGYAIPVSASGSYLIQFSAGSPQTIPVGTMNIKVDFINGNTISVNRGLGPL